MKDRTPVPYDRDAEWAIIGDLLALPEAAEGLYGLLEPEDFYEPRASLAFRLLMEGHERGERHDTTSLRAAMAEAGLEVDPGWLADCLALGAGAYRRHAETVVRHRLRRQIMAAAGEALHAVQERQDPGVVLDRLYGALEGATVAHGGPPAGFAPLDEWLLRDVAGEDDWVIPGLLRRGWRVVIVAQEGHGKSLLLAQLAVAAAAGVHPLFTSQPIDPVRALIVDLENPEAELVRRMRRLARAAGDRLDPERVALWSRPSGVDLRQRRYRGELERAIRAQEPDVVCLGPLYKAFDRRPQETDEEGVREMQAIFDDLRTRYSFALVLEHHAPQFIGGSRVMRPFGSSLWLRWPEFGFGMVETDRGRYELQRWRGDRAPANWPERLEHGMNWPWQGDWDDPSWRHSLAEPF